MNLIEIQPWLLVAMLLLVVVATVVVFKLINRMRRKDAESTAREIRAKVESEIDTRRKEAELELKELALQQKATMETELSTGREKIHQRERELDKQGDLLETRTEELQKQERLVENNQRKISERISDIKRRDEELDGLLDMQRQTLHQLSGLSVEEATDRLLKMLDQELVEQTGSVILKHEKQIAEVVEQKARDMLLTTIQRYGAAHTAETTTSTVDIPNDEMKGRIIGREGRNIRAIEKATGADVIIDDTPGVVIVSAFDPVRREIARTALNSLIADGRIHPSRIEEVVQQTTLEMDKHIQREGEEAADEVDVHGLHERIIHLLGRLKFRTSYSQNVLRHSIEVAFLAGALAEEMGLDGPLATRCGLLHDIGKAADHDAEGGHPKVGADLLKRYGEGPEVVHAALGHHDDLSLEYPYTIICATADACSASRPGARRETLDRYVKRMEELESIATQFNSVQQAYAVQAGREVRVMVSAAQTSDESAAKICRDIANEFEKQLTYPGEIKVTVLRETRITEVAH